MKVVLTEVDEGTDTRGDDLYGTTRTTITRGGTLIAMMNYNTLAATPTHHRSSALSAFRAPAEEVFYVVRSTSPDGERTHHLCSPLYETRPQADTELVRIRREDHSGVYNVWKSATYVELAEWRHRVVRLDGTLILRRLHDTEALADA